MRPVIKFAAIGLNHPHIYLQVDRMRASGGDLVAYFAAEDELASAFASTYPDVRRVADQRDILEDPSIALVVTAAVPSERAGIAMAAMRNGKDVMTDKPGATTYAQLEDLRKVQAETGRIFSVYYEGRFESRSSTLACSLVRSGAIGRFVHLVTLAPHAIRRSQRPAWFFRPESSGGIIADLATHSCDQFLYLAATTEADVSFARVANRANPECPEFQDFGELCLTAPTSAGYVRLDWLTPTGLPVYGDERMFIVGTEGTIEVRGCIDLGRDGVEESVYLVNADHIRSLDCTAVDLAYGRQLVADILDRTETAMSQEHCFKATELALKAQAMADSAARQRTVQQ